MCVYTGCAPLLLRHWHQNGLAIPTYPLIKAAAVQVTHTEQTLARDVSFSPERLLLLGPYCELQSRDYEPFPQQHVTQGQLAPVITTHLQVPLPCQSMGFHLSPACYKCSIWHKSSNVLRFPPTCRVLLPAKSDPLQAEPPQVLLQIHCHICFSLHQCHAESMPVLGHLLPIGHFEECKPNADLGTYAHV